MVLSVPVVSANKIVRWLNQTGYGCSGWSWGSNGGGLAVIDSLLVVVL